jgi:putative oxidoreductase
MIMAYVTADREALLSVFSEPEKFYNAAPFTFLLASLVILAFGPGWLSLDNAIKSFRARRQKAAATATPTP